MECATTLERVEGLKYHTAGKQHSTTVVLVVGIVCRGREKRNKTKSLEQPEFKAVNWRSDIIDVFGLVFGFEAIDLAPAAQARCPRVSQEPGARTYPAVCYCR